MPEGLPSTNAWTDTLVAATAATKTYQYRVKAHTNCKVLSKDWVESNAVPPPTTVPGAPTLSSVSAGETTATLTIVKPTDTGGTSLTAINVYYRNTSRSPSEDWPTDPSKEFTTLASNDIYEITGLEPDSTYQFRATAVNSVGESVFSGTESATTTASSTVPDAPSLAAMPSMGLTTAQLTITENDNGGENVSAINVYYRNSSRSPSEDWPTDPSVEFTTLASNDIYEITGLEPDSTYDFRATAVNSEGESGYSTERSGTTSANIPPDDLTVANIEATAVSLIWTTVPSATEYDLGWHEKPDGDWEEARGASVERKISGLSPSTEYEFRVRSIFGATVSAWSTQLADATTAGAVSGLMASSRTATEITITWDAAPNATGYDVQYREGSSGDWSPDPPHRTTQGTTHTFGSLSPGTAYQFQLRGIFGTDPGGWSSPGSATTLTTVADPPTISSTAALIEFTAMSLTIAQDANDGGTPVTHIYVYFEESPVSDATWEGDRIELSKAEFPVAADNIYKVETLESGEPLATGKAYDFRAVSYNGNGVDGESELSNKVTFTTNIDNKPPTDFAAPSADITTTAIKLTWTAITGATGYDIQQRMGAGGTWGGQERVTGGGTETFTQSGLTPGTEYHFRIRTVFGSPISEWSDSLIATTVALQLTAPTSAPTAISISVPGETSLTISWTAVPDANAGANATSIKEYDIEGSLEPDISGTVWSKTVTSTDATDTGLNPGNLRYYRVRAVNDQDVKGPWSGVESERTSGGKPGKPPLAATVQSNSEISLSWTAPDSVGAAITGYRLEQSAVPNSTTDSEYKRLYEGERLNYSDTGLTPDTRYTYRVRAISGAGNGAWSDLQTEQTLQTGALPAQVTGLTARRSGSTINLAWAEPTGSPTSYKIEVKIDNESAWTVRVENHPERSYVHTGTDNAKRYQYRVSAINTIGPGPPSTVVEVTAVTATPRPGKPTGLTAERDGPDIDLSWTAPSGTTTITGYKIEVKIDDATEWSPRVANTMSTATTYTHRGADDTKSYQYQVFAINAHGPGPASDPARVNAETGSEPAKVTRLTAGRSGTNINLTWRKPPGPVSSYKVEVRIDNAEWTTLTPAPTNPSYTHLDTESAKRYRYRVSAINTHGTGPTSDEVNVPVVANPIPGKPTDLTATRDGTDIDLSWKKPSGTVTSYKIEAKIDDARWRVLVAKHTDGTSYAHTGTDDDKRYQYRVSAINANGTGSASDIANVPAETTTTTKPKKPTSLTATRSHPNINLSWTKPSGTVTGYKIEVLIDSGSWGVHVSNTASTTTSYTHSGTVRETRYRYRVSTLNGNETSDPSSVANVPVEADPVKRKPEAPTSLTADVSSEGIMLAWAAPSNTGSAALTGYRIERSANGSTGWIMLLSVGPTVTNHTHDVGPNTTVHYRVFALNEHGDSPPSNTAKAVTGRDLPTAPRNLSVEAERDGNRLSWRVPSDEGSAPITGYRVERSMDTGASWKTLIHADADATSFLHREAPPGQEIHYRVIAINEHGDSPSSNTVNIRTAAIPPLRPGGLRASVSGSAVLLSWNEPREDGGAEVTGYQIDVAVNGVWSTLIDNTETTETSYTHEATPGSTLSYRVFAINSAGRGASSNVIRIVIEAIPPDAPLGVGALAQSHKAIGLAWDPPINTGGSPVTGYRIETSTDGIFWNVLSANFAATSTSYRHTNLKPATTHHYRVFAINKAGRSGPSEIVNATTLATLPDAPERLTVNAVSATQIDLVWNAPRSTGGIELDRYIIETSSDGSGWRFLVETAGTETAYQHRGLKPSTIYYYRVSAENDIGRSPVSRSAYTQTSAAVPDQPEGLTATVRSASEIYLTWLKPHFNGGSPITGYLLESSSNNGASWEMIRANTGSSNTVFTHTGLTRATVYQYRVAAINKIGTGERSEVVEAKTHAVVPEAPFDLEAEPVSSSQIDLSWSAPEDDGGAPINRYQIQTLDDAGDWSRLVDVDRGLKYSHEDVVPGDTWQYRVIARNEAGYGPPSEVVSATTDDPIERTERVVNAILPRFTATAISSSLRAITSRIKLISNDQAETRINLMGGQEGLRGIANGSVITKPIHSGTSIWASADLTGMSEIGQVDWAGDVFSVHAGLDGMLRDNILVGIAGSRSRGGFNFTDQMGAQDTEGDFSASLVSVNPYLAWLRKDVGVWITGGEGWGEFELQDDIVTERSSRMTSSMAAVGGFRHILTSPIGSFQVRAEGMSAQIEIAGNNPEDEGEIEEDHIEESTLRLRRGRVMLDWTIPRQAYGNYAADIHFQGGIRYDYNELDTGAGGTELGGGIKLSGPIFRIHSTGRIFIHPEYREWGIHALVELRSRQDSGLGLEVRPSYGNGQSGVNQLWERGVTDQMSTASTGRMSAVLDYRGDSRFTPYSRLNLRGKQADLQAGLAFGFYKMFNMKFEAAYQNNQPGVSLRGSR